MCTCVCVCVCCVCYTSTQLLEFLPHNILHQQPCYYSHACLTWYSGSVVISLMSMLVLTSRAKLGVNSLVYGASITQQTNQAHPCEREPSSRTGSYGGLTSMAARGRALSGAPPPTPTNQTFRMVFLSVSQTMGKRGSVRVFACLCFLFCASGACSVHSVKTACSLTCCTHAHRTV